nr:MAG TPA: hypothetical protein [Caudoviricetes sp.]
MKQIYDVSGKVIMQAEITSEAKWNRELMKSNYIFLSWKSAEKVILPAGAYIVHTYKIDKVREVTRHFLLLEPYEPTQVNEMSWKYTPEFQHPEMILSKVLFFIHARNSKNEEIKRYNFPFIGLLTDLAFRLKKFLNEDAKIGNCGWNVILLGITDINLNITFSNNDFRSALTQITNAIGNGCEWHIDYDNEIIYFGYIAIDYSNQMQSTKVLNNHIGTLSSKTYKRPKFKEQFLTDEEITKILKLIRTNA